VTISPLTFSRVVKKGTKHLKNWNIIPIAYTFKGRNTFWNVHEACVTVQRPK